MAAPPPLRAVRLSLLLARSGRLENQAVSTHLVGAGRALPLFADRSSTRLNCWPVAGAGDTLMSLIETRRHQMFPVLDVAADRDREALCQRRTAPFRARRGRLRGRRAVGAGLARARGHHRGGAPGRARTTRRRSPRTVSARSPASSASWPAAPRWPRAGPARRAAPPCPSMPPICARWWSARRRSARSIMRAFILRRVGLIQEGGAGSVLVGRPGAAGPRAAAGLPRPQRLPLHRAGRFGRRRRPRRRSSAWASSPRSCR